MLLNKKTFLIEVEKTAVYCGLVHKDALRLRLLAEELMGMTAKIIGNYNAAFWVETHQPVFKLHLELDMKLSPQDRKQILSVVPKDDPKKPMGIMDRIRLFFEHCVSSYEETDAYCASNGINMGEMFSASTMSGSTLTWSLNEYEDTLKEDRSSEPPDQLEQSIVASLADDILIKVKEGHTEILVKYRAADLPEGGKTTE